MQAFCIEESNNCNDLSPLDFGNSVVDKVLLAADLLHITQELIK